MHSKIYGDEFDFNRNGIMDCFESRAQLTAFVDEVRKHEGLETPLSEMSHEQFFDLVAKSGVDLSSFGI